MFEPLYAVLQHLGEEAFPTRSELNALLDEQAEITLQSGKPLRFVAQGQGKLAFEAQYEPRCYLSGEVQTRENNLHDLFNALVWLIFPRSKAAINARHYQALTEITSTFLPPCRGKVRMGVDSAGLNASTPSLALPLQGGGDEKSQRGRVRDMATLFDESGVIVASASPELSGLLRDFKWKELFCTRRHEVTTTMGFYIFGHGLHEKAMQPYLGMTGQGLVLQVDADFFSWPMPRRMRHLDERVATYLSDPAHCRNTSELTPVPLLGIPGWSADNEREEYYDNQDYFRPGRRRST